MMSRTFSSVDKDELRLAFAIAHKASENADLGQVERALFRRIAQHIWTAHGETPAIPPVGAGASALATLKQMGAKI